MSDLSLRTEGRISRRFRPWLSFEDARILEALPTAEMRRSFEALLRQQARSNDRFRTATMLLDHDGSEYASVRLQKQTSLLYGCGGGRKRRPRRPPQLDYDI